MTAPILGIVIPCFNEEQVLIETSQRLIEILARMREQGLICHRSAIFFVDDGSADTTWALIEALSLKHEEICGIKLSRNRGHQNALLCGLMTAPGDLLISVDADLQDDLNVIEDMVKHYKDGCDIVYGVRKSRDTDTFFKRFSAESYYRLMAFMKVDIVFNHADFRLLSRKALNALSEYREVNLFLRGLVRLLGYKSAIVEYERSERFAGESKYPLSKMLSFAWQGVTSFSTAPLKLITTIGFIISFVSMMLAMWGVCTSIFWDAALPGWTSTVVPMYFLGGIQLVSLGVLGEYISKIYMEIKGRPRFNIEKLYGSALDRKHTQIDTNVCSICSRTNLK
jgi:glycosyltransferase involved in cell wall biosynthesis